MSIIGDILLVGCYLYEQIAHDILKKKKKENL